MDHNRAIWLLSQMFIPAFDEKEMEALAMGIDSILAWDSVVKEIEDQIHKDTYTGGDIVRDQAIRAGYLGALSIIKKHMEGF